MHEDIVNSPKVTTVTYDQYVSARTEVLAKNIRIENLERCLEVLDRHRARYRRSISVLQATCFIQTLVISGLIVFAFREWIRSL